MPPAITLWREYFRISQFRYYAHKDEDLNSHAAIIISIPYLQIT